MLAVCGKEADMLKSASAIVSLGNSHETELWWFAIEIVVCLIFCEKKEPFHQVPAMQPKSSGVQDMLFFVSARRCDTHSSTSSHGKDSCENESQIGHEKCWDYGEDEDT